MRTPTPHDGGFHPAPPRPDRRTPPPLGVLQRWLDDPDIEEVMVVAGADVWVAGRGQMTRVARVTPADAAHCIEVISRSAGRRVDVLAPVLDARFEDGSRACVVLPPISLGGPTISIRKFTGRIPPLASFGDERCTEALRRLVVDHSNIVVAGATSSGKTTLVSSAASRFDPTERIVCAEDTAEIRCDHPHVVRLQTRPASVEGHGEVTLGDLVRTSLRLRPDRLIVGEVRGREALDMLLALSSGHRGCWSTVHATSAHAAIDRLASLVAREAPQWGLDAATRLVRDSIDAVVHLVRDASGHRRVAEILATGTGDRPRSHLVFTP